jgi:glucose-1-phosphate adenylyltransferase
MTSGVMRAKGHIGSKKKGGDAKDRVELYDMGQVATIILGGGVGTRLFPLNQARSKPATPFGGRYSLIDVPLSNSLNSGVDKIFVVTQYLSASLHKHVLQTYRLDRFSSGFIELLGVEQKPSGNDWFQGTADAVRQNLPYLQECSADYFLILSGDQLYNMNFHEMFSFAIKKDADLVIATLPVNRSSAQRMGVMKSNSEGQIVDFYEKPQTDELFDRYTLSPDELAAVGGKDPKKPFLASMGIYLFKRKTLFDLLQQDRRDDFGKHLIPTKVTDGGAYAYLHQGYWDDIGTIRSFYDANIALTKTSPEFDCYDPKHRIYSHQENLPSPKIHNTQMNNVIIADGSIIEASEISDSILGARTVVQEGTIIRGSYLMGNEFYQAPPQHPDASRPSIGRNCLIEGAIIDKNVRIGNHVNLVNKKKLQVFDGDNRVYIRDGIIVVAKGAVIPDGYSL